MSTVFASKLGSFFLLCSAQGLHVPWDSHGQTERVGRSNTKPRPPDQRLPSARVNHARSLEEIREHFFCIPSCRTSHIIGNMITCIKHGVFLFALLEECKFTTIGFHWVFSRVFCSSWKSWDLLGNHMINKKLLKAFSFLFFFFLTPLRFLSLFYLIANRRRNVHKNKKKAEDLSGRPLRHTVNIAEIMMSS